MTVNNAARIHSPEQVVRTDLVTNSLGRCRPVARHLYGVQQVIYTGLVSVWVYT